MPLALDELKRFWERRFSAGNSEKLYDRIVAQARLPIFYLDLGVPDTLEGRFLVLLLHFFAVQHRLSAAGADALPLAQDLADRLSQDMETVLREQGMSDLKVPKSMRELAATSGGLLQGFESAYLDEAELAAAIAEAMGTLQQASGLTSRRLASYVMSSVKLLDEQNLTSLRSGTFEFPKPR